MAKRMKTDLIVVHCSATPRDMDIGAVEIDGWHKARGWNGIGYHRVIRRDGTIEEGRGLDSVGAHVEGQNSHSIGVCVIGGVDEHGKPQSNFSGAQWGSLKKVILELLRLYPGCRVAGHNEFSTKACPSFDAKAWWATVKDAANP